MSLFGIISGRLGKVSKWFAALRGKSKAVQIIVLLAIFLIILFPLASIISIVSFSVPSVPGYLIPICLFIFFVFVILAFILRSRNYYLFKVAAFCLILPICFWTGSFLFGAVSFICSDLLSLSIQSSKVRFPLSELKGIVVDSEGHIYCLSRFYNRLQVFDGTGNFLRGWFVDIPTGAYIMYIDEQDALSVNPSRGCKYFTFDSNGVLLNTVHHDNHYVEIESTGPMQVKDGFDNS